MILTSVVIVTQEHGHTYLMLKLNSGLRQRKMRHPKRDLLHFLYRSKNNSMTSHYKVQPSVEIVLKFYEYLNNVGLLLYISQQFDFTSCFKIP
jgi:hypothetical protein